MNLRSRLQESGVRLRLGAAALILASLSKWLLRPSSAAATDLADGLTGLLYGMAIAFLLLSLRSGRSGCPPTAT